MVLKIQKTLPHTTELFNFKHDLYNKINKKTDVHSITNCDCKTVLIKWLNELNCDENDE